MNMQGLLKGSCLVDSRAGLGPVFLVSGTGFAVVMFCPEISRADRMHWELGALRMDIDSGEEVPVIRFSMGESRTFEVRVDIRSKPEFQQEGFFAGQTDELTIPLLLAHYPTGLVVARRVVEFSRQDMEGLKHRCLGQIAGSGLGRRLQACLNGSKESCPPASGWSPPDFPRQSCAPDSGRCGFIDFLQ